MGFWKKLRKALKIIPDLLTVATTYPYVELIAKSELELLVVRLEETAKEDEVVAEFLQALRNIKEKL